MSIGIQASTNKFAFLHVQDSSDGDDAVEPAPQPKEKTKKTNQTANWNATKKKTRRRKKKQTISSSSDTTDGAAGKKGGQMQEWIQRDQHLVEDLYNGDLRRAIELSRVEHEKLESMQTDDVVVPESNEQHKDETSTSPPAAKKEKKKKAMKTISLEEFHQHVENTLPLQKEENYERKDVQITKAVNASNFFDEVDKQADNIKRNEETRERFQNEYEKKKSKRKPGEKTNKRDQQLQAAEEKDQIIAKLQSEVTDWEEQFKHVKKRNKQLLVMLQQGEMKDKCELLLEIERLGVLRDELTEEVSRLSENLEQERSRSRKQKDELLKLQAKRSNEEPHSK